jgi:hypothetical protein
VRASSDAASALKDSVDSQVLWRSTSPVRQTLVSDDSFSRRSVSAETSTRASVSSSPAVGLSPSPAVVIRRPRRHPIWDIDPDSARSFVVVVVGSSFAVDSTSVAIDFLRNQSVVEVGRVHPSSPAEGLASSSPAEGLFVLPSSLCLAVGRLSVGRPEIFWYRRSMRNGERSIRRTGQQRKSRASAIQKKQQQREKTTRRERNSRRGIRSLSLSLSLSLSVRKTRREVRVLKVARKNKQTHPWW